MLMLLIYGTLLAFRPTNIY